MNNCEYPEGSDSKEAPWNEEDLRFKEVEVTVSLTLSKTVKVKVKDYTIVDSGRDEDGEFFEDIDYSECDLKKAVKTQIDLPQDAGKALMLVYFNPGVSNDTILNCANNLSGWNVDDFEVVLEE